MPSSNFLATEVNPSGLTALIKNLGRDCHPTQFLREFTKNAIEACQRTGEKNSNVIVDYNEALPTLFKIPPELICCVPRVRQCFGINGRMSFEIICRMS